MRVRTCLAAALLAALSPTGAAMALEPRDGVVLRALDKVKGDSRDISVRTGQSTRFGRLEVTVRACWQSPPEDEPESAAFLEIRSAPTAARSTSTRRDAPAGEGDMLFSGWMFASSPGLSALEHPTYDVWVIACSAASPSGR